MSAAERLDQIEARDEAAFVERTRQSTYDALRGVLALHADAWGACIECSGDEWPDRVVVYPCPTVRKIEEALR